MRRNLVGVISAIFVIWAGLSFLSPNQIQAKEKKEKRTDLELLKEAHKILVEADHDYDGHRLKAVEATHKAIEELEHHHAHKTVVEAPGTAVVITAPVVKIEKPVAHGKPDEPQAESDAQLHKALSILEDVHSRMNMKDRHPEAEQHVHHAIDELHTALNIK